MMNVQRTKLMENIDQYSQYLSSEFIEEAMDRQGFIHTNRLQSRNSLQHAVTSMKDGAGALKDIADDFKDTAAVFGDLQRRLIAHDEAMKQLARSAREMGENLERLASRVKERRGRDLGAHAV